MTKRPFYVDPGQLTPLDQLRAQLYQLSGLVGQLGHGLGGQALTILPLLDEVVEHFNQLDLKGQSLPGEASQLEAVLAQLRRKLGILIREAGGMGELEKARRARSPSPDRWWWFPERLIADERRASARRLLLGAVAVAALLGVLAVVYNRFFAPSPAVSAAYAHEQTAQALLQRGDLAGALAEIEQALGAVPDQSDWVVLKGVLQRALGQAQAAETTWSSARPLFGSESAFLLARARNALQINALEPALADAQAAVALEPDSALGNLVLGQVYEQSGRNREARDAYQRASDLADIQDQPQIAVMARVQLGMLMQRPVMPSSQP